MAIIQHNTQTSDRNICDNIRRINPRHSTEYIRRMDNNINITHSREVGLKLMYMCITVDDLIDNCKNPLRIMLSEAIRHL